jgi:hypothetical protein
MSILSFKAYNCMPYPQIHELGLEKQALPGCGNQRPVVRAEDAVLRAKQKFEH